MASDDPFEVAVIGSGFGGCIAAIELAKVFKKENDRQKNGLQKKVLILERGIWYMSPEAWLDPENKVANFVKQGNRPYRFWVMPDSAKASLNLLAMLRTFPLGRNFFWAIVDYLLKVSGKKINPNAIYDLKDFDESFALVASGVGGGSLVYANVTIPPEPEILDVEYKESDRNPSAKNGNKTWKPKWKICYDELEPFMMFAKHKLIEVSKVYSVESGLHEEQMWLPKTKEFRDATNVLRKNGKEVEFELTDLSITEAPSWDAETKKYTKNSAKFCKRQGRCVFGCLPGARHSLNKKLVEAIDEGLPIEIRELADVSVIEPVHEESPFNKDPLFNIGRYKDHYKIYYKDRKNDQDKVVSVRTLILAAGSFGTTGLILRSKELYKGDPKRKKTFGDVSDKVGTRLSLNGDAFGFVIDTKKPVYITRGPIDTAHVRFKKKGKHVFTIEDATIPRIVAGSFADAIQRYLINAYEDELEGEPSQVKMEQVKEGWEHHLDRQFLTLWRIHPLIGFAYEYIKKNNNDVSRFFRAIRKRVFAGWRKWGESQYGSGAWLPGTKDHDVLPKGHTHRALDDLEVDYLLSRVFFFACMGVDSASGVAWWDPKREKLEASWADLAADPIYAEIQHGMGLLGDVMVNPAKKSGNRRRHFVLDPLGQFDDLRFPNKEQKYFVLDPLGQLFAQEFRDRRSGENIGKKFSLHPLGGCPMDTDKIPGAVTCFGKLKKKDDSTYENLYLVDGSIVPTALGVNPSLTISGLAFRIVDEIIRADYNTTPVLKNAVVKGKTYQVTIRDSSKAPTLGIAVATIDPERNPGDPSLTRIYDSIVYVKHLDPRNLLCKTGDLTIYPKRSKVSVRIDKVEGRFTFGTLM